MKKPVNPKTKPPSKRTRPPLTITMSEEAIRGGKDLAKQRGIKLAQLIEQTLRAELRKANVLPPEGTKE